MEASQINKKAGFSGTFSLGKKPALLIIDFQKGFTQQRLSPLASEFHDEVFTNTNQLITAANEKNLPVYFTAIGFEENMEDAGIWVQKCVSLNSLKIGSEAVEIDDRFLYDSKTHTMIIKKYASAFFGTNLASLMTGKGIDSVIIAGTSTSGCVRASVVDAMQHGFMPILAKECIVDRTISQHESNMIDMQSKYAEVMSVKEIINYLSQL